MDSSNEKSVSFLKEQGNACVKDNKFEEAVLHYSHAIKIEPDNYSLYSNRSYAFLKIQQYSLAMEDALTTIRLNQNWAKGYFRKAEVELATFRYEDAYLSYKQALVLQPEDNYISECLRKTGNIIKRERKADEQIPWVGAGVGLICGVVIVIADMFTATPTLNHPLLMVILTMAIAMIGFGIAKLGRWYQHLQREEMYKPSCDLFPETNKKDEDQLPDESSEPIEKSPRYTKAQARQRFKKGKL
ncbi:hsp70-Hsp90 organizing protein 3-like [Chrysoperla carnea]|uniref:hsp70-Hsp90 organizing protein 3-like n=1 Tax=Chrysoperla carnea TaxID=189513 RepID=UPI001D05D099|nr:hsp70-Hsp90 organizing protein 3-like [Chrysoperla carnea]